MSHSTEDRTNWPQVAGGALRNWTHFSRQRFQGIQKSTRFADCALLMGAKRQLVKERFPISRHPARRSWHGLICRMRMRREQLHTSDHPLLLVIEEPILSRFEAGNDGMPGRCRMLGRMLAWRAVAASDVPALRASPQMKPPALRRRQTFHAAIATWLRSRVDPALSFFHFRFSM